MSKNFRKTCKGFTLLELLVVVLIIGILAGIALPQYRRAMEKSKASQALLTLDSLRNSFNAYYLANGKYPTKFSDVDILFPNMTGHVAQLNNNEGHLRDTISDKDWSLQIQGDNPNNPTYYLILITRISGKYKGGGLMLRLAVNDPSYSNQINKIICYERAQNANFTITNAGSYCEQIMNATFLNGNASGRSYSI